MKKTLALVSAVLSLVAMVAAQNTEKGAIYVRPSLEWRGTGIVSGTPGTLVRLRDVNASNPTNPRQEGPKTLLVEVDAKTKLTGVVSARALKDGDKIGFYTRRNADGDWKALTIALISRGGKNN